MLEAGSETGIDLEADLLFASEALVEAKRGAEQGEVPVGAVLIIDGFIVARAHNEVEKRKDASAHAELLCLQAASQRLGRWRLSDATLYSTLEPCAMCAGSILLYRLKRVVYGAADLRHGGDGSLFSILQGPYQIHRVEVRKGVLAQESAALLREFFQNRRKGDGSVGRSEEGETAVSGTDSCPGEKDLCLCKKDHSVHHPR